MHIIVRKHLYGTFNMQVNYEPVINVHMFSDRPLFALTLTRPNIAIRDDSFLLHARCWGGLIKT